MEQVNEKEQMRLELEQYLTEFREKKGADGTPLVQFPSNFDTIVEAMGRKDLNSNNPWSKYLLEAKFDSELKSARFEEGRYKNVLVEFEKEEKFRKGMAEIELLDKQLGKLNRKARDIKVETTELEMMSIGNLDDTFVTRLVTPGGKSIPSSTRSTPSQRRREKLEREKRSEENNDEDSPDNISDEDFDLEQTGEEKETEAEKPMTEEEVAQELRLKMLLEDEDESGEVWKSIIRYGYSADEEKRVKEIDDKLLQYQREREAELERRKKENFTIESDDLDENDCKREREGKEEKSIGEKLPVLVKSQHSEKNKDQDEENEKESLRPEKVIGDNYLKEQVKKAVSFVDNEYQKMATVRRKYSQQLDLLLTMVKDVPLDLSGLIDSTSFSTPSSVPPSGQSSFLPKIRNIQQISQNNRNANSSSRPTSAESKVSSPVSIFQLTPLDLINPNRVITISEVQNVIQELCYSQNQPSSLSRLELDRMLLGIREESSQLSEMRRQHDEAREKEIAVERELEKLQEAKNQVTYGEKLREYFQRQKTEEIEEEERILKRSEYQTSRQNEMVMNQEGGRGNVKNPSLSRMTALELKSYKEKDLTKEKHSNNSQQKPKKKKDNIQKQHSGISSPSLSRSNSQTYSTLSVGLTSDLESISNRMNNVLNRASRAVNDEKEGEDENDLKMKQLLEEIYSIDFNPTHAIDEDMIEKESEILGSDERLLRTEDLPGEEDEISDERKFEEYLKKWSSDETKGVF